MVNPSYRPHIDGLRAMSVALVILFHLDPSTAPGGFIGVDVFFVISGYVITNNILTSLQHQTFSFSAFYARRTRRILPALIVLVVLTLAAGYLLQMPGNLRFTGASSLAVLSGTSNMFFYYNTGYFDPRAQTMPLLHTWSLGVEEQFYLLWPAVMLASYRLAKGPRLRLTFILAGIVAAGYVCALWTMKHDPLAAFYRIPARMWELAAGGLMSRLPPLRPDRFSRWLAEIMPLAGLLCIAGVGMKLDDTSGAGIPLAVISAASLVYHSGYRTLIMAFLSLPPLLFLGEISYSLYLWHWPLIVLSSEYTNAPLKSNEVVAVVLATVSWRFVEQPFRRGRPRTGTVFVGAAGSILAASALSLLVVATNGFPERIPPAARPLASNQEMVAWRCPQSVPLGIANYDFLKPYKPSDSCVVGANWQSTSRHAMVWGDSNAEHLLPLLDDVGKATETAIIAVFPCPSIISPNLAQSALKQTLPDYNEKCGLQRDSVVAYLARDPSVTTILMAARWSNLPGALYVDDADQRSYTGGLDLLRTALQDTISRIASTQRTIVIMNDIPGLSGDDLLSCTGIPVKLLRRKCTTNLDELAHHILLVSQSRVHESLRSLARPEQNIFIYSPEDYLCDVTKCVTSLDGDFLYRDGAHLRRNMSEVTRRKLIALLHLTALFDFPKFASSYRKP